MKKFLGILVSITLCLCMLVPAAFAADDASSLSGILEGLKGVDLGALNEEDLSGLLGGLNLEGFDVDSLKSAIESGDSNKLAGLEDALKTLGTSDTASETTTAASSEATTAASGSDSALGGLSDMLGGIDMSWITDAFSNPDALSSITDMFSGATDGTGSSGFDLSALMDTISGAFSGSGIDLSSITSGIDLGSFDISSLLGGLGDIGGGSGDNGGSASGGDAASGATDAVSGIMDKLMSGLSGLGLDTSMIEGLLDNEIVDFFANLYIGLGQVGPSEEATTAATTTAAATTKPAVVTQKAPKTGDTSAVVVAVATLAVASAAAFVCLKKKED